MDPTAQKKIPPSELGTLDRLPNELRDVVYSYLLKGENVKESSHYDRWVEDRAAIHLVPTRRQSTAHTYQFHTNILLASKSIREEAKLQLRSSDFIFFSFQWPNPWSSPGEIIHTHNVPVVSESQAGIDRFAGLGHDPIHLYLRFPTYPDSFPAQGILILPMDLRLLLHALPDSSALALIADTKLLSGIGDSKLRAYTGYEKNRRFELSIQPHRVLGAPSIGNRIERIMKPFLYPVIPALKVSLNVHAADRLETSLGDLALSVSASFKEKEEQRPFMPPGLLSHIQSEAGPERLWIKSWAFDTLDRTRAMLRLANALILEDDYPRAILAIQSVLHNARFGIILSGPEDIYVSDSAVPLVLLWDVLIRAASVMTNLLLRVERFDRANDSCKRPFTVIVKFVDTTVTSGLSKEIKKITTSESRQQGQASSIIIFTHSTSPCWSNIDTILDQASTSALPARTIDFYTPGHIFPPKMHGWEILD
ncbi:uncharacterized protein LTR77_001808 [Saxophila tyrrhenica]|uniref:Uncharacterized protein n=1 Tax=Saxophila tyrrhenica TaxID=1690608 RepID=A0AAV9PP88_9PEZI|nr:hypothetical protein LTR77_001808 [Saxophila tyrrhenica]